MIKVTVKLFPPYSQEKFNSKEFELDNNYTTKELVKLISLPNDSAFTTILNSKIILDEVDLKDGDSVSILPVISGG